nr:hypothetical protein [Candidatus Cyanaurora vandensis]
MAQYIGTTGFSIPQGNITHQINQTVQTRRVQILPRKNLRNTPLSDGFSSSMASIAASTKVPMVGCLA